MLRKAPNPNVAKGTAVVTYCTLGVLQFPSLICASHLQHVLSVLHVRADVMQGIPLRKACCCPKVRNVFNSCTTAGL